VAPVSEAIARAVIMARGLGTRMRQADPVATLTSEQERAAAQGVKGLVPVGRPFLDYLLSAVADAGFREVCLVTGPEHDSARSHCDALAPRRLDLTHAIQTEPRGTADAVAAAADFAGQDEFLVINSDNYYPVAALRAARELGGPGLIAFSARAMIESGGVPRERVGAFPRVVDAGGFLSGLDSSRVVAEDARYVSMNCWRFGPTIFEGCRAIGPSSRGELELPDAVDFTIRTLDQRYRVEYSEEPVLDLSSRADIARVTRQLQAVDVRL
jgi:glucose-1-phosphate thymidylyltransferase